MRVRVGEELGCAAGSQAAFQPVLSGMVDQAGQEAVPLSESGVVHDPVTDSVFWRSRCVW